jgi:hypothetical protein
MTRISLIAVTAGVAIGFSACTTTEKDDEFERRRANQFGYRGGSATEYQTLPQPTPGPAQPDVVPSAPEPTPEPQTTPAPVVQETVEKDYPHGSPVPGKPGFVTSPHAPYSGYVDVRGFPPGTEVRDPYSGKIFLVP